MAQFRLQPGGPLKDVHPDWMMKWGHDVTDPKLKKAIWLDPRFSDRICDRILESTFAYSEIGDPEPDPVKIEALNLILEQPIDTLLLDVGISWLAPVLAPSFMRHDQRNKIENLNRSQMKTILEYKDHVNPDTLDTIPEPQAYYQEGSICIDAWLTSIASATATRAKLAFPPVKPSVPRQTRHRVALCDLKFSRFPSLEGVN